MPLKIVHGNITTMKVDAIVCPTDPYYSGGGGLDGQIHRAAGEELDEVCLDLPLCETGTASLTPGYKLPCKYIIHTTGPVWQGGARYEKALLESCYKECLKLAKDNKCKTVAFPLISSGTFRYPKDQVFLVAMNTISEFLMENEMLVYIVVYDKSSYEISKRLTTTVDEILEKPPQVLQQQVEMSVPKTLEEALKGIQCTFTEYLFQKIREKDMSEVKVYKLANLDRKHFSKIRNNKDYQPSKRTVLALACALKLSLGETSQMLAKAGFALCNNNITDIIVSYFIMTGHYNVMEINLVLFDYGQQSLGF